MDQRFFRKHAARCGPNDIIFEGTGSGSASSPPTLRAAFLVNRSAQQTCLFKVSPIRPRRSGPPIRLGTMAERPISPRRLRCLQSTPAARLGPVERRGLGRRWGQARSCISGEQREPRPGRAFPAPGPRRARAKRVLDLGSAGWTAPCGPAARCDRPSVTAMDRAAGAGLGGPVGSRRPVVGRCVWAALRSAPRRRPACGNARAGRSSTSSRPWPAAPGPPSGPGR